MLSLDQIREQYPDTKDLADAEILSRVSKLVQLPLEQVAQDFGIANPRKAPKGALGGVNDFMINAANSAVGALKSGVDFFAPGSSASQALGGFIESGEQKLSLQERLSQERLGEALSTSDIGTQASGVWERLKDAPLQTAGQALGSFAIPGAAIKGARGIAGALGAGQKGLANVGSTAGFATGAILSGGDAAGDAFDRVLRETGDRELATQAAREASIAPAIVGGVTSLFGADKALARGGSRSILRTTGGEFAGEFLEEGTTKASANYVVGQYVPGTDVMAGVFGSGLMGGIQGAGTGAAVGLMSRQRTMLAGANETGGDGSGIGKAINVNEADVNTKTAIPPRQINVTPGGDALITPQQQQAYDQFGRNQVGPFPPTPVQQSGQVAAANVKAQAAQQQQQVSANQQKQQQVAQQQFSELANVYGLSGGQPGMPFTLSGKNLFTQGDAENFLRAVDKLNEGRTLEQKQAFGAVVSSGAVKIKPDATPKAVVNSINTFMEKWGLGSSENLQDLAARIDANIARVEGANASNVAGPLNDLYRTITGQDSAAFDRLLDIENTPPPLKPLKKEKAASTLPAAKQPSTVTTGSADAIAEAQARIDAEEASKTTGAVNDGQLQVQDNAGLRDVRVQGGAAGSNQEGLGLLQPKSVQPIQSGSVVGGQNGVKNDVGGDAGTRAGTNELPAGRDADTRGDELTEAEAQVRSLIGKVFGERNADIIYDVLRNDLSSGEIGKKYDISQQRVDQIAGPKAQATWGPRIKEYAKKNGISTEQLLAMFAPIEAEQDAAIAESGQVVDDRAESVEGVTAPEETTRTLSDELDKNAAQQESSLGREDLSDNEEAGTTAGFGIIGSVGGSQSETGTGNDLTQQWMDAIEKGDTEEAARIQGLIQGGKSAVQKPSTKEVPVRKRTKRSEAVGEGNAEGSKAAPEAKAETKAEEVKDTIWKKDLGEASIENAFGMAVVDGVEYQFGSRYNLGGSNKNQYEVEVKRVDGARGDGNNGNVVYRDNPNDRRSGTIYPGGPTPNYVPPSVSALLSKLSSLVVDKNDTSARDALMAKISQEFTKLQNKQGQTTEQAEKQQRVVDRVIKDLEKFDNLTGESTPKRPYPDSKSAAAEINAVMDQYGFDAPVSNGARYPISTLFAAWSQAVIREKLGSNRSFPNFSTWVKGRDERVVEQLLDERKERLDKEKQITEQAKTPEQQWTETVAPFDGAPWDSLTTDQQDRVTDLVKRGEFNLAAANKIASEKPVETTTPEQKAVAERIAKSHGGTVAWQEGPLALVRAHSMLSGQPVYLPVIGSIYGRVDVESFTGTQLTAGQKATLIEQKNRLEAEAAQKHKDDPFITFSRDGIAVSKSVPAALVGVATGWKKILGLDANIYITTIEDARANKDNFTGPHRAISSAGLDALEKGSMRRMPDGSYYIAFTKSTSQTQMLEVLAHEMGHIHEREAFKNAPKETQNAIIAEHKKWVESQKGKTGAELVKALRARSTGRATSKDAAAKAEDMDSYWTSFGEWYADQVSRWAVTSEKPMSVVEKFFARLAAAMKKFYYSLKGQKYLPSETMKKFLDNASANLTTQELAGDTNNFESSSMFVGTKALKRSGSPDNLANLVTAKLMEAQGQSDEDIWDATGWYHGTDGKWRFEISDQDSEMLDSQQWGKKEKLGNILEHPELFTMYPELRNLTVNVAKSPFSSPSGAFIASDNSITMMPGQATEQEIKEVLLHEVQHAVQEIEGFSGGANPQTVDVANVTNLQKVKVVLQNQINLENELSIADKNKNAEYIKVIDSLIDKSMTVAEADKQSPEAMDNIRQLMYTLTSGEVEARNVEKRLDMDVFERQQTPPTKSQDTRNEVQILGSVGGNAASIAQVSKFAEKEIAKLPKPYQGPLNAIMDTLASAARKGLVGLAFTKDLAAMAVQKGLYSAGKYVDLMSSRQAVKTENERRVERIIEQFDKLDSKLKGTGPGSVNALLKESTMSGKWGFQPSWLPKAIKVDPEMAEKFDAMPEKAQAVIKSVFKHGYDTLMDMKKSVMDNINTEYDALIADAENTGDAKELAELQQQKADALKNYKSLMAVNAYSPYAPLKRFGNFVVVGRSADYIAAEKMAANQSVTPEERKEARKTLEKMQKDEKHYFVQFAETNAEAKAIARQNEGDYPGGVVQNFEKEQVRDSLYGGRDIQGVFYRLRNLINENQEDKGIADSSRKALNRLVNDLHLSLLSEHSARQSERRRKGIAGADDDMMRAFVTQGRATAHFLSTLHNSGDIYDSLQAMKREAGSLDEGRDVRSQYYNEMLKRHAMSLEYQPSPLIDKAMSATSTWMLLTSPSYYLQNMTQPMMMSLPSIAGKHGYTKSASELIRAYKDVTSVLTKNGLNEETYSKLPADVRSAIESLVNSGHIDISLSQDLGRWRSSGDQNIAAKTMDKIRSISEDVEAINRVVTAVAAYRLDKASGSSEAQATKYAGKIVYDTHGDYSGFNAPRFSRQGIGRLATQFRKFQLIQISLIAKLGNQAFKGATAEERAIGKKALAYTLTHTFAVGGVMGMPGFAAIAWILGKVFGDSDEPDNPEATLRKMIGDDSLADLLLKGVPKLAGVDLSGKLGMGQMLSVLPYTDINLTRDGYAKVVTAAMGPFVGGIMPKVVDGVAQISNGEYYKGIETMAPSGLGQAMKGYRFGTEGITKRNGDVIMSPEEITFFDAFMQGVGLPTNTITDRQYINRTEIQYEKFYDERTSDIKRDYISAYKSGDSEAMEKARTQWMEMQESRQANGFKRQPMSDLFRAPVQSMKREVRTNRTLNTSGATAAGFQLR